MLAKALLFVVVTRLPHAMNISLLASHLLLSPCHGLRGQHHVYVPFRSPMLAWFTHPCFAVDLYTTVIITA